MKKPEEFLGRTIGDYTIEKLIGSGGMANVYLARQNSLARKVALKVFSISDSLNQSCLKRFYREAQLAACIQHENVVQIYSIEKEKDIIFIVMEYLQGPSLAELSKEIGSLNEKQTWLYALDVCRGLQAAYEKGVIHRDIKPANLILDENESVKITDFGLSRRFTEDSELTKTGMILGTPQFISPEQVCGEPADLRSDIYSLGASLYRLLTGSALFSGKTSVEVMIKHKITSPFLPQFYRPQLSESTTAILGKMLHKDSKLRYQNYEPLIKDIYHLLSQEPLEFALPPECFKVYNVIPKQNKKEDFENFEAKFSYWLKNRAYKTIPLSPEELKSYSDKKTPNSKRRIQEYKNFEIGKMIQEHIIQIKSLTGVNPEDFQILNRFSQKIQKWCPDLTEFFYEQLAKDRITCPLEKIHIQEFFSKLFSVSYTEDFWMQQKRSSFFALCRRTTNKILLTISFSLQEFFFEKTSKEIQEEALRVSVAFNRIFNTIIGLNISLYDLIEETDNDMPTPPATILKELQNFCEEPSCPQKKAPSEFKGCPIRLHCP
jgi:serine/threonine protein kinase